MALVFIARHLRVTAILISMECDYQTNWFSFVDKGQAISCNVRNLEVTTSLAVIDKVEQMYEGNETVKGLLIRHQKISYIPSGIADVFEHLEGIFLEGTELQTISKEDFKPFPELKELHIIRNHLIVVIPGDVFVYNQQLQCVDLSENSLLSIDCKIFASLVHLRSVYLNLNKPYIDEQATTKTEVIAMKTKFMENCQSEANGLNVNFWIMIVIIIVKFVMLIAFIYSNFF